MLLPLVASAQQGDGDRRTVERTLAARSAGMVEVLLLAGRLEVEGWERDEVAIEAELGSAVGELEVRSDGRRIQIQPIVADEERRGTGAEIDLRLRLPAASRLSVRSVAGELSIVGARGHLDLETVSGSIEISGGAPREVLLGTATGEVRLAAPASRVRVRTAGGGVRIERPVDDLAIVTATGNQTILAPLVLEMRLETVSGHLVFDGETGSRGRMIVRNHDGTTELRLPDDLSADLWLRTRRGVLGGDFETVLSSADGGELSWQRGGGRPRIEVESLDGDILVLRSARMTGRDAGSGGETPSPRR